MRIGSFASSVVCLATGVLCAAGSQPDAVRMLATAPLRFESAQNDGSSFVAQGLRYRFSFERNNAVLHAGKDTVCLTFDGASKTAQVSGVDKLRSVTNILRGNKPEAWRTSVPNYGRLQVSDLYPGISLVYYGNGHELEYDIAVKAGADSRQVRLRFRGGNPHIDRDGNLVAGFIQKRPVAYQIAPGGTRVPVASRYRKNVDGTFGFTLGSYDNSRDLIIDPVLTFSSYFGGSQQDYATAIGHDAAGFIYVAGTTDSSDFPLTANAYSATLGGTSDLFFVKIDPNAAAGSQVIVSTIIGGTGAEVLNDMAVAPGGQVYLTGATTSSDLPAVNAQQSAINGTSDAFVMKLDPTQSGGGMLVYSTYLGGSGDDSGNGVTFDSHGRILVSGTSRSTDFPLVAGFQSVNGSLQTAFVAVVDTTQNTTGTLVYSSYIGGAGGETGRGIAASPDGTLWVVGSTHSGDFPVTGFSYSASYKPGGDAFIAQINPNIPGHNGLLYATYLGGSGPDEAKSVVVDPSLRVIVSGYTGSADFPVTPDAYQAIYGGNFDAFLVVLNPAVTASDRTAQIVYSTFFGGSQADIPFDLKRDPAGNLYMAGFTDSPNFPVSGNALEPTYNMTDLTMDAFAVILNPSRPSLGGLVYSTYLASDGVQTAYGIDYDTKGNIWVAGYTSGPLLDNLGGATKGTSAGNTDAFVLGFKPSGAASTGTSVEVTERQHRRRFSAQ